MSYKERDRLNHAKHKREKHEKLVKAALEIYNHFASLFEYTLKEAEATFFKHLHVGQAGVAIDPRKLAKEALFSVNYGVRPLDPRCAMRPEKA